LCRSSFWEQALEVQANADLQSALNGQEGMAVTLITNRRFPPLAQSRAFSLFNTKQFSLAKGSGEWQKYRFSPMP
jgi:hypothetical protein